MPDAMPVADQWLSTGHSLLFYYPLPPGRLHHYFPYSDYDVEGKLSDWIRDLVNEERTGFLRREVLDPDESAMMKAKKFRRRADDDDGADGEDSQKLVPKPASEKPGRGKEKSLPKTGGPILLSFAEDDEYEDTRGTTNTSGSLKSRSRREKTKGNPLAKAGDMSLLSFEDGTGFTNGATTLKSKKKSGFGADKGSGPKLGFGRGKSVVNSLAPSNVQPQVGEYTKEKLAELQRNTIRLGVPGPPADNKSSEPVVVLKGLVKPAGVPNGGLLEGNENRERQPNVPDGSIGRGRERADRDRLRRESDDAESRLGLMGIGIGAESGGITHIPDAAAIAAAKAKRERLRQAQAAPDYISLAMGDGADLRSKLRESTYGLEQGNDSERGEDDSSADEAEIQGRLAFLGEKTTDQKKIGLKNRTGVFESVEERVIERRPLEEQRDEDEEDEERRWEEEQLRKGFGKRVDEAGNRSAAAAPTGPSQAPNSVGFGGVIPTAGSGWGHSSERLSVQQQAEAALAKLLGDLQRMKEKHTRTEAQFARTEENMSLSVKNVSSLERTLAAAGEKYLYMQELRDYISVLCDFLQDKAPLIEELEEHMQGLHEERANAVSERRAGDNTDELAEVEAAVGAAKTVFSKGGGTATALASAAAATASFSARDGANLGRQLDEFGRDVNLQKRMESKRRAQARAKRAAKAASRRAMLTSGDGDNVGSLRVEGESSSEESESEATAYQSRREEVLDTAGRIFGDAMEDYSRLRKVKEKLEDWKARYPSAYRDGYVSLSAPALFAPYVRLELLQWDPLYADKGFTNMDWYKRLSDYGMLKDGEEPAPGDIDGDLVPKLVEKVALPILHHEIARCWDRLSAQGTRRAVIAVEDILVYVPAPSEPLQELLSAIRTRMADAVSTLDVPTWSLQVIHVVPQAARLAAQKFGTAVRLLRNIGMWKDVLSMSVLEELALDNLLSAKILPHLRTLRDTLHDAVTRTERVMAAMDHSFLGSSQLSPKLASFVEYITTLTQHVEKKRDSGASIEDGVRLARRVKVMLVKLNEYDRARQLVKHFQLKEAL